MKRKTVLSKRHIFAILMMFAAFLLLSHRPVQAAAAYKAVPTNTGWPAADRTIGAAVFSSSYTGSGHSLDVVKNGTYKNITGSFNGGTVISNGKIVYYCAKTSGKWCLYKADLAGTTKKKIGTLAKSAYNIDLAGLYKNKIYYIIDSPEGTFATINLKSHSVKKLSFGKRVSRAAQSGKYFVLCDGTGAGYSYLGLWNAAAGKFKTISKKPIIWESTSKYVYYAEQVSGNLFAQGGAKVRVRRYQLLNGKKKTLTKTFKAKGINQFTGKFVKYYNSNNKLKTIRL